MCSGSFEMDYAMPDLTDDFDFGEWLDFPPDNLVQGGEDGRQLHRLGPNRLAHSPTEYELGGSSYAFDSMPDVCDEQRPDITGPSYLPTSFESPEGFVSCQDPVIQSGFNLDSLGSRHGVENLYGGAAGTSGDWRLADATTLEMTESEMTATGGCRDTITVAPSHGPPQSLAPNVLSDSSSQQDCTCISCLRIGIDYCYAPRVKYRGCKCRSPGCASIMNYYSTIPKFLTHERSHYGQSGKYTCLEEKCQVVTKNFGDLRRHYKAKHCTNPDKEQFPCPVVWCKYSGNNGFARKDKLKSHYNNIHEGKPGSAKAGRVVKPATLRPKVSGLGGSASKQE